MPNTVMLIWVSPSPLDLVVLNITRCVICEDRKDEVSSDSSTSVELKSEWSRLEISRFTYVSLIMYESTG